MNTVKKVINNDNQIYVSMVTPVLGISTTVTVSIEPGSGGYPLIIVNEQEIATTEEISQTLWDVGTEIVCSFPDYLRTSVLKDIGYHRLLGFVARKLAMYYQRKTLEDITSSQDCTA